MTIQFPAGLDAFLVALQAEGVPVDPLAVTRLHHAFGLEPALDRVRLKHLLACTLLKDANHRPLFEGLFAEWCPDAPFIVDEETGPEAAATEVQRPAELARISAPSAPDRIVIPAKAAAGEPAQLPAAPAPVSLIKRVVSLAFRWLRRLPRLPMIPLRYWLLIGAAALLGLAVTLMRRPAAGGELWLTLSLAAWLSALAFWFLYQSRARLPQAAADPRGGPAWAPLTEPSGQGPELLDPEQIRTLVWGVGRFVSEDLTRQLDLDRTVAATARAGGVPMIHYQRAIYPREVWLWRDMASEDALGRRLVEELALSLNRAGLPVRCGVFRDFPEWVRWREGQEFSPLALEGHRQSALVAVLTDGAGLAMANQSERERGPLSRLLRELAEWPQLAFVDCGRGRHGLAALLQSYGLRGIAPEDLPSFLGVGQALPAAGQRGDSRLLGDLRAWAAALALAPDPVDDGTAYALLSELGLELSAWRFQDLLPWAEDLGGRIAWPPSRRIQLLNWLAQTESLDAEGAVAENGLLGKALAFWLRRYQAERERRQAQEKDSPLLPWKNTPAAQRLTLEEGLLELWRNPAKAAEWLYPLYQGKALREEVRSRLAGFAPRLRADRVDMVSLPWVWEKQPAKAQRMLFEMGFNAPVKPGPLQVPGTVSLASGLGLGITVAAAVGAGGVAGALVGLAGLGTAAYLFRGMEGAAPTAAPSPIPTEEPAPVTQEPLEVTADLLETVEGPSIVLPRVVLDIQDLLLEMVELPGGTFLMGSSDSDDQAYDFEKPQHPVTVSGFAMSRYLVTRQLYREVMKEVPSEWKQAREDARLPANYVNWFDAIRFCNTLSERQGLQPCYRIEGNQVTWDRGTNGYRLPTEAEWEYAVRAGTTTRWFCGDEPDELERYAWFNKSFSSEVHPVGEKDPNPWGFYDLAGNVWEWCWDWFTGYSPDSVTDPVGPPTGDYRVLRGGAYWLMARRLRSADRYWFVPAIRFDGFGFRCVRASRRQL